MRFSQTFPWMVKFAWVTDSSRNSHSPCVLISSWENCVALDELEKGTSLSSLPEERGGGERGERGDVEVECSSSLTTVNGRSDGDVAALGVKGELVDVHLTGGDHPDVLI